MINLKNISKIYNDSTVGLDNFNYEFANHGFYAIIGESGSGKSTLINILASVISPTSGKIIYEDKSLKSPNVYNYRKYDLGVVFQDFNLLKNKTVKENLSLPLALFKDINYDKVIGKTLKMVDLEGFEDKKITELSGGEVQRVAIARVFIKNPKILILDEPTSNLDSENSEKIFKVLKRLATDHLIIVSSHNQDLINKFADIILCLEDGKVINENKINTVTNISIKKDQPKKSHKLLFNRLKTNLCSHIIRRALFVILTVISLFGFLSGIVFKNYDSGVNILKTNQKYYNDEIKVASTYQISEERPNGQIEYYTKNKAYPYLYFKEEKNLLLKGADYIHYNYNMGNRGGIFKEDIKNTLFVSKEYNIPNLLYGRQIENNHEIIITDYVADYIIYYHFKNQEITIQDLINKEISIIGYSGISSDGPIFNEAKQYPFTIVGIKKTVYSEMFADFKNNIPENANFINDDIINLCSRTYILEEDFNNLEIHQYNAYLKNNEKIQRFNGYENECLLISDASSSLKIKELQDNEIIIPKKVFEFLFNEEINAENYYEVLKDKSITFNYTIDENTKREITLKIIGFNHFESIYVFNEFTLEQIKQSEPFHMFLPSVHYSKTYLHYLEDKELYVVDYFEEIMRSSNQFVKKITIALQVLSIVLLVIGLIIGYQAITLTIEENKKEIGIYYNLGISKMEFMMINLIEALIMIILVSLLTFSLTFTFATIINNTYIGSIFGDYSYDDIANFSTYIYQISSGIILWGILYLVFVWFFVLIIPTAKLLNKDIYEIIKEN